MKRFRLLLAAIWLTAAALITAQAQSREIYESPQFKTLAQHHKQLAVLPFAVTMTTKRLPKGMTPAAVHEQELQEGKNIQSALHTYFLKHQESDHFTVSFQDVNKTNTLLAKAGITPDNLATKTTEELAKLLGVDGVVSGTFVTDKPLSDGAAVAMTVLVGVSGPTNSGRTSISINDGATGELLWKYDKSLSRGLGSDTSTIINAIMRKCSKMFPYARA
ncbi:hypothetical protein F0P96_09145 [Hymenobacter busanensis]|uniref:Uncharacterized protein n=1 Tax=Hymenobacter busanensis TaxID=2607656 RepID=A0A7L4ZY81_9BACT|nr:hypothetical protein [Hymenobacter busanensis]KAA9333136.1 hypothetical protein F0P96_09145 [Hymenobacter busanensis]QHJ08188.1 hypothetical protein GUY19_13175 [Hymenobacter busanensis]